MSATMKRGVEGHGVSTGSLWWRAWLLTKSLTLSFARWSPLSFDHFVLTSLRPLGNTVSLHFPFLLFHAHHIPISSYRLRPLPIPCYA